MHGLGVLLFAAAAAYGLALLLRVPPIPLLLISGIALPLLPLAGAGITNEQIIDTLVLGTTMLVFVTGMELNPKRTRAQRDTATLVGTLQFLLVGVIGFGAALMLRYSTLHAGYLALALTASSTVVVVRLLQRRRQFFEPFGRLVLGVLLLQDLLVLLLVPVITDLPLGWRQVGLGLAATLALALLAWLAFRYLGPLIERLDREDEVLLLTLLGVLFVFVGLADLLELPLVTGAFLAGVALSRFPLSGMVRTHLGSITEFFSALFFIALGALIGVPSLHELAHALAFAAVVVIVTPPVVTLIGERAGMSTRAALEGALLISQTSEISLILGLFGYLAGTLTSQVFTVIALFTLITMVLTPVVTSERMVWTLMRLRPSRPIPQRRRTDILEQPEGHVLVLGSGTTGTVLLETILVAGHPVMVVDDDAVVIDRLREADVPCLRGDAADANVLVRAGAQRARIITSTIRRPRDNRLLLELARDVPTLVRVFDEEDADWITAHGGTAIIASHAAADEMMRWFDEEFVKQNESGRP
jgi:Kef-type K+ transport system membrane component KefB